jgi:hypothetical protein
MLQNESVLSGIIHSFIHFNVRIQALSQRHIGATVMQGVGATLEGAMQGKRWVGEKRRVALHWGGMFGYGER